jgi:hypothetical protein
VTRPTSAPIERRCAGPGCDRTLERPRTRGRPPIYCSPTCRAASHRHPTTGPILVEIDHTPTAGRARPAGRIWLVRLRRGQRTVTVAADLGRPSAEQLAAQITQVIAPRSHTQGAAID